jgi:NAD(P)H-dependent FMN reductase
MGCTINRHCEILILVGSAQKKSNNYGIVRQLQQFLIDKDIILKLIVPDLSKLPIFSEDIEHQICKQAFS